MRQLLVELFFVCLCFRHGFTTSSVTVDQGGIQTDNITMLNDDSTMTCAAFSANKVQQTKVYDTSTCSADQMTVTVVGSNLGCLNGLYVVGMSAPGVGSQRDRWTRCTRTWQATDRHILEWCSFSCHCTGGCQQLMVAKWPMTLVESSWTLCAIRQNCGATHCPKAPCYHGGTCTNGVCECPAFCHGDYCEDCDRDPYPPQMSITVGSTTFNIVMEGEYIVFMRRRDNTVSYHPDRNWNDYETGFGSLAGEFWLGNEYVHLLTTNGSSWKIRLEMLNNTGVWKYVEYNQFSIGPESDKYRLQVSGYNSASSTADDYWTDALANYKKNLNGMAFTTNDRDNDLAAGNCASGNIGAWWYNYCADGKFTGHWQPLSHQPYLGIRWGDDYYLRYVAMMIKVA